MPFWGSSDRNDPDRRKVGKAKMARRLINGFRGQDNEEDYLEMPEDDILEETVDEILTGKVFKDMYQGVTDRCDQCGNFLMGSVVYGNAGGSFCSSKCRNRARQ